jgi:hypothetical protein
MGAAMALRERNPSPARELQMRVQARWLELENGRLARENEQLRQQCADLSASAELWIHLYESALLRTAKGSS